MGWSAGSTYVGSVIRAAVRSIPDDEERERFYSDVLPVFMDSDWDTWREVMGIDPTYDALFRELYPALAPQEEE